VLTNNNRVYLNEIYEYDRQRYDVLYEKLYHKLSHVQRPKLSDKIIVCMHIRRGDWDWQPLEYNRNIIQIIRSIIPKERCEIHIYSLGSTRQMNQIQKIVKADFYHFNTNVQDTIADLYNADICIGGHSCFPKVIALFSRNLFIYLPFNDGKTKVLGGGVTGGCQFWGNSREQIDESRWIMTDIAVSMNRATIIEKVMGMMKK
jgi:hypothetical protein